MKFAIVHPSLKTKGGAENVVVWLAEYLCQRGHDVTIFTSDYDKVYYGNKEDKKYRVITLTLGGYAMSPILFFKAGITLARYLASYDIINPHNFPAYIWCYIAKKINPKIQKIVWFCEEPYRLFYRNIIDEHVRLLPDEQKNAFSKEKMMNIKEKFQYKLHKYGIKLPLIVIKNRLITILFSWKSAIAKRIDIFVVPRLDLILTNSEFIAWNINRIFHVQATACLLGVPPERFVKKTGANTDWNFLLTVARLFPEKNIENCILAVKLLVDRNAFPFLKYYITGTGPLHDHLQELIVSMHLEHIVSLEGFVSEEKLTNFYANAGLVMYLSLDETYGLVFPEAAYNKKPVIGPNHGGPMELVIDGITGLQVDPLNPQSIADGIEKIMKMDYKKMGQKGYEYYMDQLTFDAFIKRYMNCIRKLNEL